MVKIKLLKKPLHEHQLSLSLSSSSTTTTTTKIIINKNLNDHRRRRRGILLFSNKTRNNKKCLLSIVLILIIVTTLIGFVPLFFTTTTTTTTTTKYYYDLAAAAAPAVVDDSSPSGIALSSFKKTTATATKTRTTSDNIMRNGNITNGTTTTITKTKTTLSIEEGKSLQPLQPILLLLPKLCLVHVGKTAGGTLTCRLMGSQRNKSRLRSNCKNITAQPILSQYLVGKLHKYESETFLGRSCNVNAANDNDNNDNNDSNNNNNMIFLVTIRNPIKRIRSWFDYENPRNNQVKEIIGNRPYLYNDICQFDTITQISYYLQIAIEGIERKVKDHNNVDGIHNNNNNNNTNTNTLMNNQNQNQMKTCAKRAWFAITGQVGFQYHNTYNYDYYNQWINTIIVNNNNNNDNNNNDNDNNNINRNKQQPQQQQQKRRQIMVIRSEYLQDDWNSLEDYYNRRMQQQQKQKQQSNNDEDESMEMSTTTTTKTTTKSKSKSFFQSVQMNIATTKNITTTATITNSTTTNTTTNTNSINSNSNIMNININPYQHYLCIALCQELIIYKQFINEAINLTPKQRNDSLHELIEISCPTTTSTSTSTCPTLHPTIKSHEDPSRQKYKKKKLMGF